MKKRKLEDFIAQCIDIFTQRQKDKEELFIKIEESTYLCLQEHRDTIKTIENKIEKFTKGQKENVEDIGVRRGKVLEPLPAKPNKGKKTVSKNKRKIHQNHIKG